MDSRETLIYLDIYHKHDWDKVYNTLISKDISILEEPNNSLIVEAEIYSLLYQGYRILTILDEEYPEKLKQHCYKPPFVIYYKEDLETVTDRYDNTKYDRSKGCFID